MLARLSALSRAQGTAALWHLAPVKRHQQESAALPAPGAVPDDLSMCVDRQGRLQHPAAGGINQAIEIMHGAVWRPEGPNGQTALQRSRTNDAAIGANAQ